MLIALGAPAVASAQSETVEYYGLDGLGSVRVIFDAQGTLVARMDYGPFGGGLSAGIKFPSEQFAELTRDGETDLDYARARNYSPGTGRFNRVDPVYAGLFVPQRWNRYAYALNSPLVFSDPDGMNAFKGKSVPACETFNCNSLYFQMDLMWLSGGVWGGWGGDGGSTGWGDEPGGVGGLGSPPQGPPPGTPAGTEEPTSPGPAPGPSPDPPSETENSFQCAARLSSRVSLASLAGASSDNWFMQTFGGNDFASLTDLLTDFNVPNLVDVAIDNPFPLNLTTQAVGSIGRIRVGPKDVATNVRTTSWGSHEVDGWMRRMPIAKTAAGRAAGFALKLFSSGKLWYDGATYGGALVYCMAK